jgi:hypothetical protein
MFRENLLEVKEVDETSYLLNNQDRANRLQKAIQNVRNNLNVKSLTFDELEILEKKITN